MNLKERTKMVIRLLERELKTLKDETLKGYVRNDIETLKAILGGL